MLGCPGFGKSLGGVQGCPSVVDVRLGCGVVAVGVFKAPGLLACMHLAGP